MFKGFWNLGRYVGLRHLTEKPVRTLLTVLGVTLGFSLFIAIRLINESTLASFEHNVRSITGNAVLTVTAGEAGFPEAKLETIEKTPGVKSAVPLVQARAYVVNQGPKESLNIFGVDMLREQSVRQYESSDETPVDDFLSFLNQPDSIVVSKAFAQRHALQIDSPLELMTAHGLQRFVVRGMLSPTGAASAYGGNLAVMDIDGVRQMFGKQGLIDRVDITREGGSEPTNAVTELQHRLESALGAGYQVAAPETQAQSMQRMVAAFQKFLSFISTLAILIGLFMVGNTISVAVTEKRIEIGSLRAFGTTRPGILALFLGEAALLGAVGGFLGALLGTWLAGKLGGTVAQTMSQHFQTTISDPAIGFSWQGLLRATLFGAAVAVAAGFRPARHAMDIQPIEAIRRSAEPAQSDGVRWLTRLFAAGCAALLLLIGFILLERVVKPDHIEGIVQVLVIFVINLTAPLLAFYLFKAVRTGVLKAETAIGRLALENLLRSPKRTTGNVLVLKVGLILFVTITTVHHSFRNSIATWLDRVLQSDIVVSSYGDVASFQIQPLEEKVARDLQAIPKLAAGLAAPVRGMRYLHLNVAGGNVGLTAYDEPEPELHYSIFDFKKGDEHAGAALFHDPNPTVLISANLATRLDKQPGDSLSIDTPKGTVVFRIAGVINDFSSSDGVVAMDRKRFQQYWSDSLLTLIYLKLKPGVSADEMRGVIDAASGADHPWQVTMNRDVKAEVSSAIDRSFHYLRAVEGASLLIALLALLNTMLISIIERRRELGLLRAAGMSRPQLFGMILTESLVLGVIAVSLSIAMGSLLSYLWVGHTLESLLGWSVPFSFPVASILGAALLGIGVCLISSLYPAGRAAFLPITEAVANE